MSQIFDTVVVFHYRETPDAKINLDFFLQCGQVHRFKLYLIIAGGCSLELPTDRQISILYYPDEGSDFASYKRFVENENLSSFEFLFFINCTMRGPFLLHPQEEALWTEAFRSLLTAKVRLVGPTINLLEEGLGAAVAYRQKYGGHGPCPHVQSMMFATDRLGLSILKESKFFETINFEDRCELIVDAELRLTMMMLDNGFDVSCILNEYRYLDYRKVREDVNPTSHHGDPWFPNAYFGRSLHPYETIFFKTNRGVRDSSELNSLGASQMKCFRRMQSRVDWRLDQIGSAWKGHKNFARWLVNRMDAKTVVDLGVDFGYSTICFAEEGLAEVYGIDSFEGDCQAGLRDTYEQVKQSLADLEITNVKLIKGFFSEIGRTWELPIDILHIDGLHDYESVLRDFTVWRRFVTCNGVVLFHDTEVSHFGVRRLFDEIDMPKTNFLHSSGLGVVSENKEIISEINAIFSNLII